MKTRRAAFTLIELLVVIGLIAVVSGVLGLALGRGNSGTALQSGQSTTVAMLAGARARAAVTQQNAAVLINVTPSSGGFLRELRLATTVDGSTWIDTGTVSELPNGIFVVPANSAFTSLVVEVASGWDIDRRSNNFNGGPYRVRASDTGSEYISPDDYRVLAQFTPLGGSVPIASPGGTLPTVVLAPAERESAERIRFPNADALRGMTISTYGIPTLINDPAAF